jgi:hypothetical protein
VLTAHLFCRVPDDPAEATGEFARSLAALCGRLHRHGMEVVLHSTAEEVPAREIGAMAHPRVYVSLGQPREACVAWGALPPQERDRWLHFGSPEEVEPRALFQRWLEVTDPLPAAAGDPVQAPPARFTRVPGARPLVSVFTAAFRSRDKILRPYRSLCAQTYSHWEWVIVDDSGDDDATYREALLPLQDPRVRRYRQDARCGYIGAVKRLAAGLCVGDILVEVDHDDDLTPDCLERLVEAFRAHPECGFVYAESAELTAGTLEPHWYGWTFAFGFGVTWREWVPQVARWLNVCRTADLNIQTVRHLVGLPNHPRAWTRECYYLAGGHRPELVVADDYDLLLRTALCTRFLRVPRLCYLQYRNATSDGGNQTFIRNAQIQLLCGELWAHYAPRVRARFAALRLPAPAAAPAARVWELPHDDPWRVAGHVEHADPAVTTLVFPVPYFSPAAPAAASARARLMSALSAHRDAGWRNVEAIIVGNVPRQVERFAATVAPGTVRWWPMEPSASYETCLRYAELLRAGGGPLIVFAPGLASCARRDPGALALAAAPAVPCPGPGPGPEPGPGPGSGPGSEPAPRPVSQPELPASGSGPEVVSDPVQACTTRRRGNRKRRNHRNVHKTRDQETALCTHSREGPSSAALSV